MMHFILCGPLARHRHSLGSIREMARDDTPHPLRSTRARHLLLSMFLNLTTYGSLLKVLNSLRVMTMVKAMAMDMAAAMGRWPLPAATCIEATLRCLEAVWGKRMRNRSGERGPTYPGPSHLLYWYIHENPIYASLTGKLALKPKTEKRQAYSKNKKKHGNHKSSHTMEN